MKKLLIVLMLLLIFQQISLSQTVWVQRATFPGCPRYAAGGFTIGNKIYIVGGWCPSGAPDYQRDVWEYDTDSDVWTQRDSLIYGTIYPGSFSLSGKGYVFGGLIDSLGIRGFTYYTRLWEYDTSTTHWSLKNNYPFTSHPIYNQISFGIDTAGYTLVGGDPFTFGYARYSQPSDSWNGFPVTDSASAYSLDGLNGGSVCTHNNQAYLFAGNVSNYFQHWILIFDPSIGSWNHQHETLYHFCGIDSTYSGNFIFYKDSVIYFGLGTNDLQAQIHTWGNAIYYDDIYSVDLRNDSVRCHDPFPFGASAGSNYFEVNGRYFLVCGDGGMSGNKVVEFFPDSLTLTLDEKNFITDNVQLLPNPALTVVEIKTEKEIFTQLDVYDLHGKKIIHKNTYSDKVILNLDNLEGGIYLVKICLLNNSVLFKKLIKL